jgi:hypothetical protein
MARLLLTSVTALLLVAVAAGQPPPKPSLVVNDLPPSCRHLQFTADGRQIFVAHRGRLPEEAKPGADAYAPGVSIIDTQSGRTTTRLAIAAGLL